MAILSGDELWDFVEEQGKAGPWVARQSTFSRGFRLHTTSDPYAWVDGEFPVGIGETAREAVMDLYKKVEGK